MTERAPRASFSRPIHIAIPGWSERPRKLIAGNISRGGMFVRCDAQMPEGTPLDISLEAKGKVFPFARAEVVWSKEAAKTRGKGTAGFGVRFVEFHHPKANALLDQLSLQAQLEAAKKPVVAVAPEPPRRSEPVPPPPAIEPMILSHDSII